jgi:glycosyltransferase 2 family protein
VLSPRVHRAIRWIGFALTAGIVVALYRSLRRDGPAALEAWRQADVIWTWVTLAVVCGLAGHAIWIVAWQRLLIDCGVRTSLWQTARFFLVSNLGRYLPGGKAWQMGIVGIMAAENDLSATIVAATSMFQGMVGFVVGIALLLFTGGAALGVAPVWLVLPILALALMVASPRIIKSMPRVHTAVRAKFPSIESVTAGTMWALVWIAVVNWILWGIGFYLLALGLFRDTGGSFIAYIAAWIGSFLAGLIAFVAPAGLGVRDEFMRTMLVNSGLAATNAVMLVVIARVWTTALEVIPAVVLLALRWLGRKDTANAKPMQPGVS